MKGYPTIYPVGNTKYASYIVATSLRDARRLAQIRGLREQIEGKRQEVERILYDYEGIKGSQLVGGGEFFSGLIHNVCFISNVLINAKLVDHDWVLGDQGLAHQLIHLAVLSYEDMHRELRLEIKKVKRQLVKFGKLAESIGF